MREGRSTGPQGVSGECHHEAPYSSQPPRPWSMCERPVTSFRGAERSTVSLVAGDGCAGVHALCLAELRVAGSGRLGERSPPGVCWSSQVGTGLVKQNHQRSHRASIFPRSSWCNAAGQRTWVGKSTALSALTSKCSVVLLPSAMSVGSKPVPAAALWLYHSGITAVFLSPCSVLRYLELDTLHCFSITVVIRHTASSCCFTRSCFCH